MGVQGAQTARIPQGRTALGSLGNKCSHPQRLCGAHGSSVLRGGLKSRSLGGSPGTIQQELEAEAEAGLSWLLLCPRQPLEGVSRLHL